MFIRFKESTNNDDILIPVSSIEQAYLDNGLNYKIDTADCSYCVSRDTFINLCEELKSKDMCIDCVNSTYAEKVKLEEGLKNCLNG